MKFEIQQTDGISVSEKIILFFMTSERINRAEAENIHQACVERGEVLGVDAFDKGIEMVCMALELDSKVLQGQIEDAMPKHDLTESKVVLE